MALNKTMSSYSFQVVFFFDKEDYVRCKPCFYPCSPLEPIDAALINLKTMGPFCAFYMFYLPCIQLSTRIRQAMGPQTAGS